MFLLFTTTQSFRNETKRNFGVVSLNHNPESSMVMNTKYMNMTNQRNPCTSSDRTSFDDWTRAHLDRAEHCATS